MKALLTNAALARITGSRYRFCADAHCAIAYFSATETFSVRDVAVPVWQTEPPGRRMVCYCFGENEADIRSEIAERGSSLAVERVRAHIASSSPPTPRRRGNCRSAISIRRPSKR